MTFEEKVQAAKSVDSFISMLEEQIAMSKKTLEETMPDRDAIYASLLKDVKDKGIKDEKVNDLFVTYFSKEDITWLDDEGLLKKLQENAAGEFIKTKVVASVDKNALKKAFKTNKELRESYKDFYGTKLTEYVTVTTEENHSKMLDAIKSK